MCDFGSDEDVDDKDSRDEQQKEEDRQERLRRGLENEAGKPEKTEKRVVGGGKKITRTKDKRPAAKSLKKPKLSGRQQVSAKNRSSRYRGKPKSKVKSSGTKPSRGKQGKKLSLMKKSTSRLKTASKTASKNAPRVGAKRKTKVGSNKTSRSRTGKTASLGRALRM
jgi:hypothetical protein